MAILLNIYLYPVIPSYTNTMFCVSFINQTEIKIRHCLQAAPAYRFLAPLPLESHWVNFQGFLFINRHEQTHACTSRSPPLHRNTTSSHTTLLSCSAMEAHPPPSVSGPRDVGGSPVRRESDHRRATESSSTTSSRGASGTFLRFSLPRSWSK